MFLVCAPKTSKKRMRSTWTNQFTTVGYVNIVYGWCKKIIICASKHHWRGTVRKHPCGYWGFWMVGISHFESYNWRNVCIQVKDSYINKLHCSNCRNDLGGTCNSNLVLVETSMFLSKSALLKVMFSSIWSWQKTTRTPPLRSYYCLKVSIRWLRLWEWAERNQNGMIIKRIVALFNLVLIVNGVE